MRLNDSDAFAWQARGNAHYNRACFRRSRHLSADADGRAAVGAYSEALRINPLLREQLRPHMESARRMIDEAPGD
ncbi:MAG: hypothetical protein HYY16_16265 [Planctomycetes bacterium]|nr:hypothetical protein [Planctomycetota bacterium]